VSSELQPDVTRPAIPPPKKMEGIYTQINVLFPSSQVELPSAEKFKEFPPEAQQAILDAFKKEQAERHVWLKNQQTNEHALNMQTGRHYYRWRMSGTVCGTVIVIASLGFGSWLVAHGASAIGVFLMLLGIGAMVTAAIWGAAPTNTPEDKGGQENPEAPADSASN